MVSKQQHRLKGERVRTAMTTSWNDHSLLPTKSLIQHFNNKASQVGAQGKAQEDKDRETKQEKEQEVIVVDSEEDEEQNSGDCD